MIRYLKHKEIDLNKWDDCISQAINGIFYAYAWYLDMVSPSWDAIVENDYESVMPLPRRTKWGVEYVYQPYFVQQLGVFSTVSLSPAVVERFMAAIPRRFVYGDICLNTFNALKSAAGRKLYQLKTFELDLIQDYPGLQKNYSANTGRNLRKAQKSGIFVAPHGQPEDIIEAFRQNRGSSLGSFSAKDYLVLMHLIYSGMHKGMAKTYAAYTAENTFCAGAVFFFSHNKAVFLFSGMTEAARSNGAMFMLIDYFIREHAGKELVLDFEGSSDPGLARFYGGFGAKECVFLRVIINRMPLIFKPVLLLYTLFKHGTTGGGTKIQ